MTTIKSELEEATKKEDPADFETAISATGYGNFNMLLFGIGFIAAMACQTETASLSFVFPVAKCDLELSLEDKGLLNAMIYALFILACVLYAAGYGVRSVLGMISSSLLCGFLIDTFGRKKVLIIGFFLDVIFVLMTAFSQNFTLFLIAKFFGGSIINGPTATLPTYLAEFHGVRHRSRVPLIWGFMYNIAGIYIPLLAWAVLNNNLRFLDLYSWNVFLFICVFPAVVSGTLYIFLPESPKYLMTSGNNEKAMTVFQKIYHWNTSKAKETYPITKLIDEKSLNGAKITKEPVTKSGRLKQGWQQISPLFYPPLLPKFLLICSLQMFIMMNINTLKLWLPEIFQAFTDYEQSSGNSKSNDICEILQLMQPQTNSSEVCIVNLDNTSVYTNYIWVQTATGVGYIISSFLVTALGKKKILFGLGIIAGICLISVYFVNNIIAIVVLIAVNCACLSVCVDVITGVSIDLFPTTLRASAVSLALMFGRIGSVLGNLIFPILLQAGCGSPFFTFGATGIGCAFLSLILPNTDRKALK